MEVHVILYGALVGFVMSMGMQTLAFYTVAFFSGVSKENFGIVFIGAGAASFTMVCGSLLHEFGVSAAPEFRLFLPGCVGGLLVGILLSLTYAKPLLIRHWK